MSSDLNDFRWLGPFGTPIVIAVSLLGLLVTFHSYADTFGWKLVSLILFGVSSAWAAWYLSARITKLSDLVGANPRKVLRHENKLSRRVAPLLPVFTGALCAFAFLQPKEPDYSDLLQGGGPFSPVVVFDSEPPGADVRVASTLYADDDPWLENKDDEKIFHIGKTLTRARLGQGHYWAVFELNGHRIQKGFIVTVPTMVKVKF